MQKLSKQFNCIRSILIIFVLVCTSPFCNAQDIITMKNGNRIEAIVTEIRGDIVRYRFFSQPQGQVHFVYKDMISSILYQNGTIDRYGEMDPSTPVTRSDREVSNTEDVIITKNYEEIKGKVLDIGISEVKYKKYNDQTGPTYTIRKSDVYMIRYGNGTVEKFESSPRPLSDNQYNRSNVTQFSQFHLGVAFPTGKFSDGNSVPTDWGNGKGFAATGFTIGYKLYNSFDVENLYWVFSIQAFYNDMNSDAKDEIEDDLKYLDEYDNTFPKYLNFPATLGLNYSLPLTETVKIYGEAAIGANFSMLTKYVMSGSASYYGYRIDIEYEDKYTPAFGFAYGIEGGLFFNQKYSISLRYNNLGSYKYKVESKTEQRIEPKIEGIAETTTVKDKFNRSLPITNISLCFGFLF